MLPERKKQAVQKRLYNLNRRQAEREQLCYKNMSSEKRQQLKNSSERAPVAWRHTGIFNESSVNYFTVGNMKCVC